MTNHYKEEVIEMARELWHAENARGKPLFTVAEILAHMPDLGMSYLVLLKLQLTHGFRPRAAQGWGSGQPRRKGGYPEELIEACRVLWHEETSDGPPLLSAREIAEALEAQTHDVYQIAARHGFRRRRLNGFKKPMWAEEKA